MFRARCYSHTIAMKFLQGLIFLSTDSRQDVTVDFCMEVNGPPATPHAKVKVCDSSQGKI